MVNKTTLQLIKRFAGNLHLSDQFMNKSPWYFARVFVWERNRDVFVWMIINRMFAFSNRDISGANQFPRELIIPERLEFWHSEETSQMRISGRLRGE